MQESGKRRFHRGLILLAVVLVCVFLASRLHIETVDEHRKISDSGELSVSIRISYASLLDKEIKDKESFQENGVVLDTTEYKMKQGDTAFDLLKKAVRDKGIQMEYKGGKSVYVEGIASVYEFDYGELSGWMYRVNNEFPGTGCGNLVLTDGDRVEFLYTCDLGRDIGNEYQEGKDKNG